MSNLVLIDLSWVMYRSAWVFTEDKFNFIKEGKVCPSGHIFGVLRTILTFKSHFNNDCDIILCKDGIPKRRIELMGGSVRQDEDGHLHVDSGEYKAGRQKGGYSVHSDSAFICDIATSMDRVYYAYEVEQESDDLMYALSRKLLDRYDWIWIYSGDNDLLQSVNDKVRIIRSLAKDSEWIDSNYVKSKTDYGVWPEELPMFRALRGDVSDNISAVYPRLSKEFARYCASRFKTPEELEWVSKEDREGPWKTWFVRILDPNRLLILERNYKLMKLEVVPVKLKRSGLSLDEAQDLLNQCGIRLRLR